MLIPSGGRIVRRPRVAAGEMKLLFGGNEALSRLRHWVSAASTSFRHPTLTFLSPSSEVPPFGLARLLALF